MVQSIFDIGQGVVSGRRFLVITHIGDDCGTMRIYRFMALDLTVVDGGGVCIHMNDAWRWVGAQEPAWWDLSSRSREPYVRLHNSLFLPLELAKLDEIETSNGSRFLSSRVSYCTSSMYTVHPDGAQAVIIDTVDGLSDHVLGQLLAIGLPDSDLDQILADILGKFEPSD